MNMPGTWGTARLPPEIEDNFEDKHKKLGEGSKFYFHFSALNQQLREKAQGCCLMLW